MPEGKKKRSNKTGSISIASIARRKELLVCKKQIGKAETCYTRCNCNIFEHKNT